jgi:hypothetical protein
MSDSKPKFFQFHKELNLPVYIKIENVFLETAFFDLLTAMKFNEINADEFHKSSNSNLKSRVLSVEEAGFKVGAQLNRHLTDDRYGPETVTFVENHRLYRYKSQALVVYSFRSKEWHLGCFSNFGEKKNRFEAAMVLNRFLSWSLSNLGIVGFWGTPVEEGVVITRPMDSKGEAIFFDLKSMNLLTIDGVKKIKPGFKIIRLDSTLQNRNIQMRREELIGFLNTHSTFFDPEGLTVPVRQVIQELSLIATGILHPEKNFKPRTAQV